MKKYLLLFALIVSVSSFAQISDSTRRQVEISGVGYKFSGTLFTQYALGVNFPSKKINWYKNIALSVNIQDSGNQTIFALYSLSIGKSYQGIHNHLFWTAGYNMGAFHGNFTHDDYVVRHIGINAIPKLEIGYNMKKTVISTGVYFSMGVGYRAEYYNGEFVEQQKPANYVSITGALNLYLKLILK